MRNSVNKKEFRKFLEEIRKNQYSFEELKSYYNALYAAYRSIISSHPTLIVAPLRGSEPLVKAVRLFASLERKSSQLPLFVFPRVGEQTREESKIVTRFSMNKSKAMSDSEKEAEFSRIIDKSVKLAGNTGSKQPVILVFDEVFQGGSITNTIKLLGKAAVSRKANVLITGLSISDSAKTKSPDYVHLVSSRVIKELSVKRLFTVDSPHFLRPLIEYKRFGFFRARPKPGVSIAALEGNLNLLQRLQSMHSGKKGPFGLKKKFPKGFGR